MTGFLQRLVDRSVAPASSLQPRARLEAVWGSSSREAVNDDVQAETFAPDVAPARAQLWRVPVEAPPRDRGDASNETVREGGGSPTSEPRTADAPVPRLFESGVADRRSMHAAGSTNVGPGRHESFAQTDIPHASRAMPRAASPRDPEASERAEKIPAPLLARVAPTPAAARPSTWTGDAVRSASPGVAPPPPPDVHIHIGKVELTALAPEAARKPSKGRRDAPAVTTLDDYLQGRRGHGA